MKNFYLILGSLCAAFIVFLIVKAQQPDTDEIARYQAILCFVIRQPDAPHNVQQLREKMRQVQQGSIPDYAFKQPHFHETLANQWIEAYFIYHPPSKYRRGYPTNNALRYLTNTLKQKTQPEGCVFHRIGLRIKALVLNAHP
ncbi:hypothetical protein [Acinetobacter sp. ANC 5502]